MVPFINLTKRMAKGPGYTFVN